LHREEKTASRDNGDQRLWFLREKRPINFQREERVASVIVEPSKSDAQEGRAGLGPWSGYSDSCLRKSGKWIILVGCRATQKGVNGIENQRLQRCKNGMGNIARSIGKKKVKERNKEGGTGKEFTGEECIRSRKFGRAIAGKDLWEENGSGSTGEGLLLIR